MIQPIEDIIKISLKNHDTVTAILGVKELKYKIKNIIILDKININDSDLIRELTQMHLAEVGLYASENKTDLLKRLIKFNFLVTILIIKRKKQFPDADKNLKTKILRRSTFFIKSLGELSIESSNEYEAKLTSIYLGRLGNILSKVENSEDAILEISASLEKMGIKSLERQSLATSRQSIKSLRLIGENYEKKIC